MALLTQTFTAPPTSSSSLDLRLTELDRLLSRLQQSALRASAERQKLLLSNAFAREKLSTSIEHARAQLSGLERDALGVKVHAHRQGLQADLTRKREVIEELFETLRDLQEMAGSLRNDDNEDDDDDDDGGDDVLSAIGLSTSSGTDEIIATPSESMDSTFADSLGGHGMEPMAAAMILSPVQRHEKSNEMATRAVVPPINGAPETTATQSIRSRGTIHSSPAGQDTKSTAAAAAASAVTTGHNLFGNREKDTGPVMTATTEAILDQQRAEQDQLSDSMVKMARSLKESSRAFALSLEEDQAVMQRAGEGLNKNERGIEVATRRMGTLRKITEGEGWWGRMRLYAMVYGLMVALILFVFVVPKLRF